MTKRNMLALSLISLVVSIAILVLLIFAENLQANSLLQDRVFYVCLVLMGVFSALALFGYIKSKATVAGNVNGLAIELGGPAALAFLVVVGGFYLIPRSDAFDVTIRAVNERGEPVYSDRKAKVLLKLPTGLREAEFTSNGEATIKGIPSDLLNTKQKLVVDIYYFIQENKDRKYILSDDVIEVVLKENPEGTTTGILNKQKAHLEILKLLMPYRLISDDSDSLEINLEQYYDSSFIEKAKSTDLNSIC